MRLFAYEKFAITTKYSPLEVKQIISEIVETRQWVWRWETKQKYIGEINRNRFKMIRWNWVINSFQPIIIGKISKNNDGSIINIKMQPKTLSIIIILLFQIIYIYQILSVIGDWILYITKIKPIEYASLEGIIPPLLWVTILYLFALLLFKFEAIRDKIFIVNDLAWKNIPAELFNDDKMLGLNSMQIIILLTMLFVCLIMITLLIKIII